MFWWGPGWGWIGGLVIAGFWIVIIVAAIVILRRELPELQQRFSAPPALRLLEERYARGEITRDEFLHRRHVLLTPSIPADGQTHQPPPPQPPVPPTEAPPTEMQPPPQTEPPR
jgi:putative membrane protein